MLGDELRQTISGIRAFVARIDSVEISAKDAASLVESFAELERLAVAGRTLAGRRVEQTDLWQRQGYRTPAQWMAVRARSSVASAIATLETGRKLDELPATRDAFKAGSLSAQQAHEISSAAVADPGSEGSLLEAARVESVAGLRERCRQVIASAAHDPEADERIHRSRYFRHWTDADGADIRAVVNFGRTIPARLRTALEARDPVCVVPGCDTIEALEIDHIVPLARGGPTRLDNLARLCRFHHAMKTRRGWRLGGRPGAWRWLQPDRLSGRAPP